MTSKITGASYHDTRLSYQSQYAKYSVGGFRARRRVAAGSQ